MNIFKHFSFFLLLGLGFSFQAFSDTAEAQPIRLGLSVLYHPRPIDADEKLATFSPEVLVSYAIPFLKTIELRPTLRLNYLWAKQVDFVPQSIQMSETDLRFTGELNFVKYETWYRAGLAVGGGLIYRITDIQTSPPLVPTQTSINDPSLLSFLHAQVVILFPMHTRSIELGPCIRYTHVFSDPRLTWFLGIESSFQF